MKSLICSIALVLSAFILQAQTYPVPVSVANAPSQIGMNNAFKGKLIVTPFLDTVAANTEGYLKNYDGALIKTTSPIVAMWYRNLATTQWIQIMPSGGTGGQYPWIIGGNSGIFTSPIDPQYIGTLTSQGFGIKTNSTNRLIMPAAGLTLLTAVGDTTLNKPMTFNTSTKEWNYGYWFGGGGGTGWNILGNAGTTAGTNFVGTTDAQDLVFKINSVEKGRFRNEGLIINTTVDGGTATEAAVIINRTLNVANNGHGFKDYTTVTNDATSYASFDAQVTMGSTGASDHNVAFQARHIINKGAGLLAQSWGFLDVTSVTSPVTNLISFESVPALSGGAAATNRMGLRIRDYSGSANLASNNYGIWYDALSKATGDNYAQYDNGDNKHYLQNIIAGSAATAAPSAAIAMNSTTKGLLIPRMTEAQKNAISSPATGLLIFQTNGTSGFYYYNGAAWVGVGATTGWSLTGNSGTTAGTNFLGTTDDQDIVFKRQSNQVGRLGTTNTAIGYIALGSVTTGTENTAYGGISLYNLTEGTHNIALGKDAGRNHVDGNYRLYINSIQKGSLLLDSTESIIYGAMDATAATQRLYLNSQVYTPYFTNLSTQDRILGQFSTDGKQGYITVGSGLSLSGGALTATGSGGTVTSVGFTGGLISVANPTTTPAFTVAGTSGGGVYFNSASTWASTGVLAANSLLIGGGAGAAYSSTTTGTGILTALGNNIGSAGAPIVFNGALGTPSSGTATNITGLPEGGLSLTDITTNNTSTTQHGFFPKLTTNTVYYVSNAGALTALALGANGTVLTSNGATSAPTFSAAAGGVTIAQVMAASYYNF